MMKNFTPDMGNNRTIKTKIMSGIFCVFFSLGSAMIIRTDLRALAECAPGLNFAAWASPIFRNDIRLIIDALAIGCLLYLALAKHMNFEKILCVGAIMFGVVQTVAMNLYYLDTFKSDNFNLLVYDVLSFAVYAMLFYLVSFLCLFFMRHIGSSKKELKLWDRYVRVISFILMIVCWLPWLVAFYPGSMWYDMSYQLEQYYGYAGYHLHPVFSTYIMGICLDIGRALFHSDNAGVFIYILFQTTVCAAAFSKVICYLNKLSVSYLLQFISLGFYAVIPVFGGFAQMGEKSVAAFGFFTFFMIETVKLYREIAGYENGKGKEFILFVIYGLLSSFFRKEYIFVCIIVALSLFVMAFIKHRKKLAGWCFIATMILSFLYFGFNMIFVNKILGIDFSQGATEGASIPLQQVARFVYYKPDEISEDERQILDKCFFYGFDQIAENYNPYLSDRIKYNFNVNETRQFIKVWIELLRKSPKIYIESILDNSYGYYSITPPIPATVNDAPTNGTPGSRYEMYINIKEKSVVNISYPYQTEEARSFMRKYANAWRNYPIIDLFDKLGFYTWAIVMFMLCLIKNKQMSYIVSFLPSILMIGVCIASPVNDHMRYFISVIASVPLLMGVTANAVSKS